MRIKIRVLILSLLVSMVVFSCATIETKSMVALTSAPLALPTQVLALAATQTLPPTALPTQTPPLQPTQTFAASSALIRVDNLQKLELSGEIFLGNPRGLVWRLDDRSFAVVSDNQVVVYNADTRTSDAAYALGQMDMLLAISPADLSLAITSDQMTIQIVDVFSGKLQRTLEPAAPFMEGFFSPDGRWLGLTLMEEMAVELLDVSSGERIAYLTGFETAAPVYSADFSLNSDKLLWWARAGAQVMDVASGEMSPKFSHEDFINRLTLNPAGDVLAVSVAEMRDEEFVHLVQLWDVQSGTVLEQLDVNHASMSLAFSPDGTLFAAGDGETVNIWSVQEWDLKLVLQKNLGDVHAVSFSPDGRTLALAVADNRICLWQIAP